ncbi:MAG TPA: hypothetical protein VNJ01_15595 [Bacteriovoracaceae bacterium]|nr:hypothetical protein [Bacteriovoracaceae bacterium]
MGTFERDYNQIRNLAENANDQLIKLIFSGDSKLTHEQTTLALKYISKKYGWLYMDLIFEKFNCRQKEFLPSLLRLSAQDCDFGVVSYLLGRSVDINTIVSPAWNHSMKETILDVCAVERDDPENTVSSIDGYTHLISLLRANGAKYAKEL